MRLEPFAIERFQSIWENQVAVEPLRERRASARGRRARRDGDGATRSFSRLGYPQTNGTAELRDAIARMYPGATADNIQVTNGGSEANFVVLCAWSSLATRSS